jgi:isoamylase
MTTADWHDEQARSLAVLLDGDAISEPGPHGEPLTDDSFLLLFNAGAAPVEFTVPHAPVRGGHRRSGWDGRSWQLVLDTADELPPSAQRNRKRKATEGERITLMDRSLVVLRSVTAVGAAPAKAAGPARA